MHRAVYALYCLGNPFPRGGKLCVVRLYGVHVQRKQHAQLFAHLPLRAVYHLVRMKQVAVRPNLRVRACYGLARAVGMDKYIVQADYAVVAQKERAQLIHRFLVWRFTEQWAHNVPYYAYAGVQHE